jgi:hypothetical protein
MFQEPEFLVISAIGMVVAATNVMCDFRLAPLGKWTLLFAGIILIGLGLLLA